jgi:formate-dependent nitrite reductase membrane component NrfD
MNPEIIYTVQHGPYWDWKVALDLFLGGAGVGALLFAILLDTGLHGKYRRRVADASVFAVQEIGRAHV